MCCDWSYYQMVMWNYFRTKVMWVIFFIWVLQKHNRTWAVESIDLQPGSKSSLCTFLTFCWIINEGNQTSNNVLHGCHQVLERQLNPSRLQGHIIIWHFAISVLLWGSPRCILVASHATVHVRDLTHPVIEFLLFLSVGCLRKRHDDPLVLRKESSRLVLPAH